MILPPTSEISHHHKATNITMSTTSLSPRRNLALRLQNRLYKNDPLPGSKLVISHSGSIRDAIYKLLLNL